MITRRRLGIPVEKIDLYFGYVQRRGKGISILYGGERLFGHWIVQ